MSRYVQVLLTILFLGTAPPAHALSLKEMDREYENSKSVEQLRDLESRVQTALQGSAPSDELTWRLARVHYALGKLLQGEAKEQHFLRCQELTRQSLQTNKNSAPSHFFNGLCMGKLGEIQGIWASLKQIDPMEKAMHAVIQVDPAFEHGGPHRFLGRLYYELPSILGGSLDKSIEHLEKAVQYAPDYEENHLFLAEAYLSRGDAQTARKTLLDLLNIARAQQADREVHEVRARARELLKEIETP